MLFFLWPLPGQSFWPSRLTPWSTTGPWRPAWTTPTWPSMPPVTSTGTNSWRATSGSATRARWSSPSPATSSTSPSTGSTATKTEEKPSGNGLGDPRNNWTQSWTRAVPWKMLDSLAHSIIPEPVWEKLVRHAMIKYYAVSNNSHLIKPVWDKLLISYGFY